MNLDVNNLDTTYFENIITVLAHVDEYFHIF